MSDRPSIWYIHGASSSPRSFKWLRRELPTHRRIDVEYDDADIPQVADELVRLAKTSEPFSVIGHSLGGVLGMALAQRASNVKSLVTMAAPYGGSVFATYMRLLAPNTLMDHIHPFSPLMLSVKAAPVSTPTLSIVTTSGATPLINEPNDGVVTVSSQMCLVGPKYIQLPLNHFEVLLSDDVARLVADFIWEI